jgi:hypothetical protein
MAGEPYPGAVALDAPAATQAGGSDPYGGAEALHPSEIPFDQRNALLQDFIRKPNTKASDALNYAQQLGLTITSHIDENVGNPAARVAGAGQPTPPTPSPPDTSWGHEAAVVGRGIAYGAGDALGMLENVVNPAASLSRTIMRDPIDPSASGRIHSALDQTTFGTPETPGQHYLFAGTRGVTSAAPFGAVGAPVRALTAATAGAGSGLGGEAARQAGFGKWGQLAASLAGGFAGGSIVNALDRTTPPPMTETPAAPPPIPRGPMASIARITGADRTVGARLVAQRLHDDGINPYDAGRVISEAQANGTPAVLADLGENTRALAGSVSRQSGPARTIAKGFTKDRQMGQMERVRDANNRDLGPTTDVLQEAENLSNAARAKSKPFYDAFEAHDPVQSPRLDALLSTPSGRKALARAREIAADEQATDAANGIDAIANGASGAGYSPRVLDYVKKGLDDVVETFRDKTTGRLSLDEGGKATNAVRANFIKEADRLIPEYGTARRAYAGEAALRSAMLDGKKALNKSASEINQRIKEMSPAEAEQYGLGLRSAIADAMEGSPDGANKVRFLMGNPKRRAVLQRVFGGKANLDRFVSTLENEQAAFETHQAVHAGSPTANRLAEDQTNSDLNLVRGVGGDLAAVGGGHVGIGLRVLERGADLLRFGAGKAGQRAREDAASLLFSTSPSEFRDALGKITLQSRRDLYRRQGAYPVMGGTVGPLSAYGINLGPASAVDQYGNKP